MASTQLSLDQLNRAVRNHIPRGWEVISQYLIERDAVVVRIRNGRKICFLPEFSAGALYQSEDSLIIDILGEINRAVIGLMEITPQEQANAVSAST